MINLIIKKLSILFALTLLIALAPAMSGSNDARAACSLNSGSNGCTTTSPHDNTTCTFVAGSATGVTPVVSARCDSTLPTAVSRASRDQANNNAFVNTLCNIFSIATGNGGKAFAAFAIISLGIGFFTGKVSWGLMLGVAAGIAAMFGAPTIVAAISGDDAFDCTT